MTTLGASLSTVDIDTHAVGAKQSMEHSATTAGLRCVPATGDPSSPVDGDIWYNSTTGKFRKRQAGATSDLDTTAAGSEAFAVGAVFIAVVSTNPATLLGYGTWSAFGAGRVLVGLDSGDTDFDVVEETGGAKTHTLTASEMPSHTHTQDSHTHALTDLRGATTGGATTNFGGIAASADASSTVTAWVMPSATATNQNTGGGGAHNNVQPYIVVYMWKRTA